MTFLSSFKAVHYRSIDGVSFPHLAQANLLTGTNGVGKTAVLEAMWLFTGRYNTGLLWNANIQRTKNPVRNPISRLTKQTLELDGVENGASHSLRVYFQKVADIESHKEVPFIPLNESGYNAPPVVGQIHTELDGIPATNGTPGMNVGPWGAVIFQSPEPPMPRPTGIIFGTWTNLELPKEYLQRYSDLVRKNRKRDFKNAVNLVLPKVHDLEILTDEAGETYLSAVTGKTVQIPLHNLGGGVMRLCQFFLSVFAARGGVLYADEIENGLHHSTLRAVWEHGRSWLREWDVQLIATTHSDECIRAAMTAFQDSPEELAIHKLFLNEKSGRVEVATFTGETLHGVRDLNLETR